MRTAVALLLMIVAAAQGIGPIAAGSGEPSRGPPVEMFGNWTVNNVNITRDATIILTGNLTVNGPGYLELSNVTLKMNCSSNGQYRIQVTNGGRLALVNNTFITRNAGFNYSFSVSSASQLWVNESSVSSCGYRQPALGNWSPGIFVNNSRADLHGALLSSNFAALNAFSSNITFNRTSAQNNDFGVALNRSSITMRDSDINSTNPGAGPDIRFNGSNAELMNSTCRWNAVTFSDPVSLMNVSWPVSVRTLFFDGSAAQGVNVSFRDRSSAGRANVSSDAQGWAAATIRELLRNQTDTIMDSPYTIATDWRGISGNVTVPVIVNGSVTVFVGIDRDPPVVTFTQPVIGYVNATVVDFRGTASDDQGVVKLELSIDGGTNWTPAADTGVSVPWSSWNISVSLSEGPNAISARAVDVAGLVNQTPTMVTVDTVIPAIAVFSPSPGSSTNAGSVVVSGRTEPDAAVTVNHGPATSENGFFNASVPLRVGWNSIEVEAKDRAGNIGSDSLDVLRDVSPPNLTIHSPRGDFLTNRSSMQLTGQSDPDADVFIGSGTDPLQLGPDGSFSILFNLTPGGNVIEVRARDRAGNEATVTVKGVLDTIAPQLDAWASSSLTNQSQAVVSGKTEPGSNVTVAGNPVAVGPFGDFSGHVDLAQGPNRISISSADAAGNRNLAVVEIFRDVVPPQIIIIRPSDREVLNLTEVEVDGTAEDANGIAGVEVGVDDRNFTFCNGTTTWKGTVRLSEGNHTIQVIAYDRAGNSNRAVRNVSCSPIIPDITPPVLAVSYPVTSEVSSKNIRMRGHVTDPAGVSRVELSTDGSNWRPCTLDAKNGTWQADVGLRTGANRIYIRSHDALGNNATRTLDVSYVPPPEKVGPNFGAVLVPAAVIVAAAVIALLLFFRWKRWTDQPEPGLGEDEALIGFPGKGFK